MKILKNELFGTPTSVEELHAWIKKHTGGELAAATIASALTVNLIVYLQEQEEAVLKEANQKVSEYQADLWDNWSDGDIDNGQRPKAQG